MSASLVHQQHPCGACSIVAPPHRPPLGLAYATAIGGTPWLLIAKIDQREADAEIRAAAWLTALVVALGLLLFSFPRSSVGMPCGRSASGLGTGRGAPALAPTLERWSVGANSA